MKALIAFIIMAALITVLIEVNERMKKKRHPQINTPESRDPEDCPQEKAEQSDCSACALMEVCEKEEKKV